MEQETKKAKLAKTEADFLFEISWEACNKVGGIYTVLSSKATQTQELYNENYCLIGPYKEEQVKGEFQEHIPPENWKNIFIDLEKQEKIRCHFGKWLVKGEPSVILIDFKDFLPMANQIKAELWEKYKIDSWGAGFDFNEPVVFGYAVGKLIEKLLSLFPNKKIVAHFHEWLSGSGLLYLKKKTVPVGTVFTTHATTVGRVLVYNNVDLYPLLQGIDAEKEAVNYNVKAKHQLEKETAKNCDVFTTVSEITGLEAKHILGRLPDFLLLNGLDNDKFVTFEEISIKHRLHKNRLREFLLFYFFPYYTFDLENTFFYFIIARYEFKAKGIDIFIKALSQLNQKLLKINTKKTIVAFFWIPTSVRNIKPEILESREYFQNIKDSLEEVSWETKERILYAIAENKRIAEHDLFREEFLFDIKKKLLKLKKEGLPPLCTHDLDKEDDLILKTFKDVGLLNKKEDKVKVVFYPVYLSGHDGLSNLNHQESIQASHLGVFPSFYEPWGYTPLEAAASGVPSITTDLTGFGRFCQKINQAKKQSGVFILERFNKTSEESASSLADILYRCAASSKKERVDNKIQARRIAACADWEFLIKNYLEAHNAAVAKL